MTAPERTAPDGQTPDADVNDERDGKKGPHKRWLDVERVAFALDVIRAYRGMSWRAVARESGVDPSVLHRLSAGGQAISADNVIALFAWAGISDLRPYLLPERRAELDAAAKAEPIGDADAD